MGESELDLQGLEAHSRWLERLALRLLGDAGAAEDVVQDTWAAYWARPQAFDRSRSLRAYLGGIARNLVRRSRRAGARRHARDAGAARGRADGGEDAAAIVERAERRQRLAAAVLELREPYRSTLLAHFQDGRSCEQIAERAGVPASTVRNRLRRGLALLRRRFETSEASGLAFLLPLTAARAAEQAALSTTGSLTGLTTMQSSKSAVAASLAFLGLSAGFLAWTLRSGDGAEPVRPPEAPDAALAQDQPADPGRPDPPLAPLAGTEGRDRLGPGPAQAAPRRPFTGLVGRLLDPQGHPVAHARIEATPTRAQPEAPAGPPSSGQSGAEGGFALALASGTFDLWITAAGRTEWREADLYLAPGQTLDLGDLELQPAMVVLGRVVDPDGRGIAGAEVRNLARNLFGPHGGDRVLATTDAAGRFQVDGIHPGDWELWAAANGFLGQAFGGTLLEGSPPQAVTVELEPALSLTGRLVDASGREDFDFGHYRVSLRITGALPEGASFQSGHQTVQAAGDGGFLFPSIAGDADTAYTLSVTAWHGEAFFFCTPQLPLRAGDGPHEIPVSTGSLTFGLDPPVGGPVKVTLSADGEGFHAQTLTVAADEAGLFRLADLPTAFGPLTLGLSAAPHEPLEVSGVQVESGRVRDLGTLQLEDFGRGTVTVLDGVRGLPLAGARIVAARTPPPESFTQVWTKEDLAPPATLAVTDAAGRAQLPLDGSGELWIQALHDEFAPSAALGLTEAGASVELTRGGSVRVETGSPGASQLALRKVAIEGRAQGMRQVRLTDEHGVALFDRLPPGDYHVGFEATSSTVDASNPRVAVHVAGDEQARVELPRQPLVDVRGTIQLEGRPLVGAQLLIYREAPEGVDLPELEPEDASVRAGGMLRMLQQHAWRSAHATGSDGRFLIPRVLAGRSTLLIRHPGRPLVDVFALDVREAMAPLTLRLAGAAVRGTVDPAAGAWVVAFPAEDRELWTTELLGLGTDGSSLGSRATAVAPDGSFALDHLPVGRDVIVAAIAPEQALHLTPALRPGVDGDLELQLTPGATLVLGAASVVDARRLGVASVTDPGFDLRLPWSDAGRVIEHLPPGVYELTLRTADGQAIAGHGPQRVELRAGERLTVDL